MNILLSGANKPLIKKLDITTGKKCYEYCRECKKIIFDARQIYPTPCLWNNKESFYCLSEDCGFKLEGLTNINLNLRWLVDHKFLTEDEAFPKPSPEEQKRINFKNIIHGQHDILENMTDHEIIELEKEIIAQEPLVLENPSSCNIQAYYRDSFRKCLAIRERRKYGLLK